jgi:TBC1 domain family protein 5
MHDAMLLWDGLFACDPTFGLARWVCVAMLIRIRNHRKFALLIPPHVSHSGPSAVIPSDYSGQLTYLLRYPAPPSLDSRLKGSYSHITLLLKQALTLQMSPSPSTGASVILENYNILNIAIEVPVPALPSRRHVRDKSAAVPRSSGVTDGPSHHSRQHSSPQVGLPEMIARGLLDRGENLGINKTLMNAVTEIKVSRNGGPD